MTLDSIIADMYDSICFEEGHRPDWQARKNLAAGLNVDINDECVEICRDIVNRPLEPFRGVPAESDVPRSNSNVTATCSICRLPFDLAEGLYVEERGILCPACVQAVQAALVQ